MEEWLIRKNGLFYRPNRSGYTAYPFDAGLYTEDEAQAEARVESSISAHHASEFAADIQRVQNSVARFHFLK
jgi:hypothetical protein